MDLYKSYISLRITFFDIYMYAGNEHRDFQNMMSVKKNKIESLLSAEIKVLEESVGVNEKLSILDLQRIEYKELSRRERNSI